MNNNEVAMVENKTNSFDFVCILRHGPLPIQFILFVWRVGNQCVIA